MVLLMYFSNYFATIRNHQSYKFYKLKVGYNHQQKLKQKYHSPKVKIPTSYYKVVDGYNDIKAVKKYDILTYNN